MVRVVLNSPFPRLLGVAENLRGMTLEVPFSPGKDLGTFFSGLAQKYPTFSELIDPAPRSRFSAVVISHNGKILAPGGRMKVQISDGDELVVMYPYAGG